MKILIHDYGGYAFKVQLSRELARRGHQVLHTYCASTEVSKGDFFRQDDDPEGFEVLPIAKDQEIEKYSFFKRWFQEARYGDLLAGVIESYRPAVVISANTPLAAQQRALEKTREVRARFVFWLQDLIGLAAYRILGGRLPGLGHVVGGFFMLEERRLLQQSDAVVAISEDFLPRLKGWGVAGDRVQVVHNWAPIEELPRLNKVNEWSESHGIQRSTVLLYAGTLGLKHNPGLLLKLALHFREREEVSIVVVSEGLGARWLEEQKRKHQLPRLLLLGYQPYHQLPMMLASADVLAAILEPDAGVFSVPSKVLSYLCAGRALLLAVPPQNLAARIVVESGCGLVVAPTRTEEFVAAAERLMDDPALRDEMGEKARRYAETTFDIGRIGDRFEEAITRTAGGST